MGQGSLSWEQGVFSHPISMHLGPVVSLALHLESCWLLGGERKESLAASCSKAQSFNVWSDCLLINWFSRGKHVLSGHRVSRTKITLKEEVEMLENTLLTPITSQLGNLNPQRGKRFQKVSPNSPFLWTELDSRGRTRHFPLEPCFPRALRGVRRRKGSMAVHVATPKLNIP